MSPSKEMAHSWGVADRGRLLVFGTYDASLHPRVAVLRDGLAAHGWVVRELNEPLGASTADKVRAAGSPGSAARLAGKQVRAWSRLVQTAPAARASGGPDVVLVGYMGHADVHLARRLFPRARIVLDHLVGLADTVRDRQLGGGPKTFALEHADRSALRAADLVVVDTDAQVSALPAAERSKAVVVPVGAGAEWYAAARTAPSRQAASERLRVIFFGLYTPLQGAPVIGAAIGSLAEEPIDITMVGTGQDYEATRLAAARNHNVTWIDWVAGDALPGLVADHDVCLGVFGTGPKTQRVVPTKVYQGMAAGCAVITADTRAVAALGDAVTRVPVGDADALAAQLAAMAGDRESVRAARERARRGAEAFTPRAATQALDEALLTPPLSAPLPPLTLNAWLRWDVIGPLLEELDPATVLEIGPGEGAAACRLARGRAYTGVELSDRTRRITEERLRDQGTPGRVLASLEELDPEDRFDLVCAFEVIEHIDDDAAALQAWAARVAPGGTLLLSTPADPNRMGPADVMVGHFRRYAGDQLIAMAQAAGLADASVRHTGYPFGYLLEAYRNHAAKRVLAAGRDDPAANTEMSSSRWQPPAWAGTATRVASAPGRLLQRRYPSSGTGLLLIARAPS